MEYLFDLNHENKKSLLAMMRDLLMRDGKMHGHEWQYVEYVARELSISLEDMEQLPTGLNIPKKEKDRMAMFYYLLFLAKIDGDLNFKEEASIHEYAFKLGFNPLMAHDFIALLRQHLKDPIPIEKMLEVIKKYMN